MALGGRVTARIAVPPSFCPSIFLSFCLTVPLEPPGKHGGNTAWTSFHGGPTMMLGNGSNSASDQDAAGGQPVPGQWDYSGVVSDGEA
jgi:hypothetical protein